MPDFSEAVIGYALRCDEVTLIYDFTKIVKLVMKQHRITLNEAIELAEGIEEVWFGEGTPIIFHGETYAEIKEIFGDGQARKIN
jgi:hypothetical protein